MLKTSLRETKTGKEVHIHPDPSGDPTLVVTDYGRIEGSFASVVWTTATASTTVIAPKGDQGIVLTDLIISAERTSGGSVTLRFRDASSNIVTIARVDLNDAPVNMAIPFKGRWGGWQAAYLEVVVVGSNNNGSVAVGYYRTSEEYTLPYSEWNARR